MTSDEMNEMSNVELLTGMMGDLDPDVALRVLRKCAGDVQKAATAILEGDRGEEPAWPSSSQVTKDRPIQYSPPPYRPRANSPVIDLTGDDDSDLSRALKASLESQKFGPSERAPDPQWAIVPSNVETGSEVQYYHTLNQAIEASLDSNYHQDADELYEPLSVEKQARMKEHPVTLRPTLNTMTYAALILHGLFFVPQVRERVARWTPTAPPGAEVVEPPQSGPEHLVWGFLEMFVHMDLANLAELNVDPSLELFHPEPWTSLSQRPGDLSNRFLSKVSRTLETVLTDHLNGTSEGEPALKPRVFYFLYGRSDADPVESGGETCIVKADIGAGGNGDSNGLISCLSTQFSRPHDTASKPEVIFEPSEIVAFQISRTSSSLGSTTDENADRKIFGYPTHIYMDQFLHSNFELANSKRTQQREMSAEIQKLLLRKKLLTRFNDKDTVKDLQSTIYYYEHVADSKNDPERASALPSTAGKLRSILRTIQEQIENIDKKIIEIQSTVATVFDCPELKKVRYDLRVVFVHDGLFGRKHLYSYVQDKGIWWKVTDSSVLKVTEETVLNDTSGLHLNAGPYLLIYSRAVTEATQKELARLPWPEDIKAAVKHNNNLFLSQLPDDLAKLMHGSDSPLGSPVVPSRSLAQTPSEHTFASSDVEPSFSEGDAMDITPD